MEILFGFLRHRAVILSISEAFGVQFVCRADWIPSNVTVRTDNDEFYPTIIISNKNQVHDVVLFTGRYITVLHKIISIASLYLNCVTVTCDVQYIF